MKINKLSLILGSIALMIVLVASVFYHLKLSTTKVKPINTMLMLIEHKEIDGVLQWERELDKRNLTALINVQNDVLKEYPEVFKRLADKGYEIGGHADKGPFWDMPYEEQYESLKEVKELVERITGKKMRVCNSGYFSYDENTLKAADALGIEYVLGRGVNDVEAMIYQPEEYKAQVISVSNVDVGEPMGRGSLCDYSLWARGADGQEFGKILNENIAKKPNNMIVVSHAYLGGTRLEWWNEYNKILSSDKLSWNSFDKWIENQKIISLPNSEIPINREVKYGTPNPAKPMEDYEPIPGIKKESNNIFSDDGTICQ